MFIVKRKIMLLALLLLCMFFMSSCGSSPEEIPAKPATAATNTPILTLTSVPTFTPSPTDTPTPPPTSTPIPPFRDDFTEILGDGWEWLSEYEDGWNLDDKPGFLFIEVQVDKKQILARKVPEGNFEISTRVLFQPYHNFQQAGLIIYNDDLHFLDLVRGMAYYTHLGEILPGNAIYFDYIDSDVAGAPYYNVGSHFGTRVDVMDEAYFRLTRVGRIYTADYSPDGEEWINIGTHESDMVPLYVGLRTCCSVKYLADSYFDYFTLKILP